MNDEMLDRFQKYCEDRDWTPLIEIFETETVISFISPEPEVEYVVHGIDLEMAIKKVLA